LRITWENLIARGRGGRNEPEKNKTNAPADPQTERDFSGRVRPGNNELSFLAEGEAGLSDNLQTSEVEMIKDLCDIFKTMGIPYHVRGGRSGKITIEIQTVYWNNAVVQLHFNQDESFKHCEIKGDDSKNFQNIIDDKVVSIMKNLTEAIERSK